MHPIIQPFFLLSVEIFFYIFELRVCVCVCERVCVSLRSIDCKIVLYVWQFENMQVEH
jgi:hypothetical protein